MPKNIFALVDCNNFYVSCERVFNPKLKNLPVIVLSNNDGCVIARSNEVKILGIKIGQPVFKCSELVKKHDIQIYSSNYTLYSDMSKRIMEILSSFTSDIEIYSIDEAFLKLNYVYNKNYLSEGKKIKKCVERCTGIPVSIGIAPTKQLTKIANKIAKKNPVFNGVLDITSLPENIIDSYLEQIDIIDIWGISKQYTKRLKKQGIRNAKNLKYADSKWIKKVLNVMGERIVLELKGISCYNLDDSPKPKKEICTSRSFGYPVTKYIDMGEAVASYTASVAEKLRRQCSYANIMIVYIKTNRFKLHESQYSNSAYLKLIEPTSSTIDLTKYALYGLKKIFKSGYRYKKAGVIVSGLQPNNQIQLNMLYPYNHKQKIHENNLMKAIDTLNTKWGKASVHLSAEGIKKKWEMRRNKLSKNFTTKLEEILEVKL